MDWKIKYSIKKYNFCCVNNWEHYCLYLVHWEPIIRIEYEKIIVYEGRYKYEIIRDDNCTKIFSSNVDIENNVLNNAKLYSSDKKLFDFSNTNKEKLLNRIKTILVFQ
jgi:hypothetical protein